MPPASSQPVAETALSLSSPQSTGLAAGDWASFGVPGDLPADQALDSFGSLEFDSAPLAAPTEILGNARVVLEVTADRPVAIVTARLIDVAPDGKATLVARGFLNLTQRESREHPRALVPGQRYRVEVQLTGTAYAFPAGHRFRVALSTAYWPVIWPAPEPVTLTVFTGVSKLLLPVRRPSADDGRLPPLPGPAAAPVSPMSVVREGKLERSVSIDQVTGRVNHRTYVDGGTFGPTGKIRLEMPGVEISHVSERNYSIHPDDPNSAHASMRQTCEIGRDGWQTRVETYAEMTSTPTSFELNAWVEAFEGDTSVCRRQWRTSIPRQLL